MTALYEIKTLLVNFHSTLSYVGGLHESFKRERHQQTGLLDQDPIPW